MVVRLKTFVSNANSLRKTMPCKDMASKNAAENLKGESIAGKLGVRICRGLGDKDPVTSNLVISHCDYFTCRFQH